MRKAEQGPSPWTCGGVWSQTRGRALLGRAAPLREGGRRRSAPRGSPPKFRFRQAHGEPTGPRTPGVAEPSLLSPPCLWCGGLLGPGGCPGMRGSGLPSSLCPGVGVRGSLTSCCAQVLALQPWSRGRVAANLGASRPGTVPVSGSGRACPSTARRVSGGPGPRARGLGT